MTPAGEATAEKHFLDGTHRVCPPEQTWERIQPALRRAGVTRVADVTALDDLGIPVYQAVRPASRNLSVSQGKGLTPSAARVSAAMEALELWHAERLDALARFTLTPREMRGESSIPLDALRWSADARRAPERWAGVPLEWIAARALDGGPGGYLPRVMLELDFTPPEPLAPRPFDLTSNGLASGNCAAEAELHALCELVERHGLALEEERRRRGLRAPALRADSVASAWCRELLDRLAFHGGKVASYDLTWEAGVPVVLAELALPDLPYVWRGSGCHPAREVALARALTEAAQSRLTYIAGARDDLVLLAGAPAKRDVSAEFVAPKGERALDELPDFAGANVASDRDNVLARLARRDVRAFALDLRRPDVAVDVVFAFAPGLREVTH
jgi:ribosomal protein S12 methylthiotransferase accessory factor